MYDRRATGSRWTLHDVALSGVYLIQLNTSDAITLTAASILQTDTDLSSSSFTADYTLHPMLQKNNMTMVLIV